MGIVRFGKSEKGATSIPQCVIRVSQRRLVMKNADLVTSYAFCAICAALCTRLSDSGREKGDLLDTEILSPKWY
jgi:hypothetical protein